MSLAGLRADSSFPAALSPGSPGCQLGLCPCGPGGGQLGLAMNGIVVFGTDSP